MMNSDQRITTLLSELVAIPSINPEGDRARIEPPFGEKRMVEYISRFFQDLGLQVKRQEVYPGRENVLVSIPGRDHHRSPLCLEAHMDTVGVEGMIDPFSPRLTDGLLFGRGACDTKASLAAMMLAVSQLVEEGKELARPVLFVAAADEEFGQNGIRRLIADPVEFSGAIVGEPTSLRVIPAHKGQVYFKIRARGKAAHTSTPEQGQNAIYVLTDVIGVLRRRVETHYRTRVHRLCGAPVLTVSTIQGGTSEHIVPDSCTIAIDRRTIPGESTIEVIEEIRTWIAEDLGAEAARRVEVLPPYHDAPPMETSESHSFVRAFRAAVEDTLGRAEIAGVPYNTDAGVLAQRAIPVIVFGPGDIAQAHTTIEFVKLEEVAAAAQILLRFLLQPG
jgi:succinyl-diaminopimelate desuccinylase